MLDAQATIARIRDDQLNRQPSEPVQPGVVFARHLPDGTPRVSPSQVMLVLECGEKYRRRYLLGEAAPTSAAQFYGTTFHAVMEDCLREHMLTGMPCDPLDVGSHAKAVGAGIFTDPAILASLKDPGNLASQDTRSAAEELELQAFLAARWLMDEEVTPLGAEETVVQSLTVRGQTVGVLGRYDGLVRLQNGRKACLDWKTSAKSPSMATATTFEPSRSHSHAGLSYADALLSAGKLVHDLLIVYVVRTKTPKVIAALKAITPADILWSRAVSKGAISLIQLGALFPNPTGNMCSEKWCEFFSTCPAAPPGGNHEGT